MNVEHAWITPAWASPPTVRALITTRVGGVSRGPYGSLNLGLHVGDDAAAVQINRARLRAYLPAEPCWLDQVHGARVVDAVDAADAVTLECADASVARCAGAVCVVLSADCLPVLMCDRAGSVVAAAHAGWRGLAAGVLEATVARMAVAPETLLAWLGPAIGPRVFEVGDDVRSCFVASDPLAAQAFVPGCTPGKWFADLFMLARLRLARAGVAQVSGDGVCTYSDAERFYSYRREHVTGRFASLVWLES